MFVCNIFFHAEVSADVLFLSMLRLRFNKDLLFVKLSLILCICYHVSNILLFLSQLSVKELCAYAID